MLNLEDSEDFETCKFKCAILKILITWKFENSFPQVHRPTYQLRMKSLEILAIRITNRN